MWLEEHNALFVHIPKCAGTSVEKTLLTGDPEHPYSEERALLLKNKNPRKGPPSLHHLACREYLEKGYLDSSTWDGAFKFTFVRNPLARLVSAYNYRGVAIRARLLGKRSWTFREFLFRFFPTRLEENYLFGHDNWTHIRPMWHFTHDQEAGECLVNFVGRLETLKDDFCEMVERTGFPRSTEMVHSNPSVVRDPKTGTCIHDPSVKFHWAEYYDTDSLDFARRLYAKDFELFNYPDSLP